MASGSSSNPDLIMEERKDLMISLQTSVKTFRKAHFLKPSITSLNGPVFAPPLTNSKGSRDSPKLVVYGWGTPSEDWKQWVHSTARQHKNVWTQAGIYDAVINSTYKIQQNNKLIFWLAERWCPETNTFVFPWGEATVTLEDMLVLGSFSVMGDSVFCPPAIENTEEIHRQLLQARKELAKTKLHKPTQTAWMEKFRGVGTEIEPVALLVYWLSRFVFPTPVNGSIVSKDVLRVAICLYKGNKIALAPAVLAGLYNDLSTLKEALKSDPQLATKRHQSGFFCSSPLKLVQVWAWERFPILQPLPKSIAHHEPIIARWNGANKTDIENILPMLDSPQTGFLWRPYVTLTNALSYRLYGDRAQYWMPVDGEPDEELGVLVRCIRVSELVSLNASDIKQYLPHRVARQFGMDQDLPGAVNRASASAESAWANYCRPIGNEVIYVPARHFQPSTTRRYWSWWQAINVAKNNTEKDSLCDKEGSDGEEEFGVVPDEEIASTSAQGPAKEFERMVSLRGKVVQLTARGN